MPKFWRFGIRGCQSSSGADAKLHHQRPRLQDIGVWILLKIISTSWVMVFGVWIFVKKKGSWLVKIFCVWILLTKKAL